MVAGLILEKFSATLFIRSALRVLSNLKKPLPLIGVIVLLLVSPSWVFPGKQIENKVYPGAPDYFLVVAKKEQSISLLQRRSPLKIIYNLPCSTGSISGNKYMEGDMKTPEGVYFLQEKITQGLNAKLYGDIAYTLNYPNPLDRQRGKTGYGIWLHGRGKPLLPRDTKGCIAMRSADINRIKHYFDLKQTPVVISEDAAFVQNINQKSKHASELIDKVRSWADSWQNESDGFFSFYHPQKFYSAENRGFAAFRARKKRLFQRYAWIDLYLDRIRVVPGGNYWVTYFGQYFRSSGFSSQGIKRLYWKKCDPGWKIVGSEWLPDNLGLEEKYLTNRREKAIDWLETWKQAWLQANIQEYKKFYHPEAVQDQISGLEDILDYKKQVWSEEKPLSIHLSNVRLKLHPQGFLAVFTQKYEGVQGYSDKGTKRLVLEPHNQGYRILNEDWSPM